MSAGEPFFARSCEDNHAAAGTGAANTLQVVLVRAVSAIDTFQGYESYQGPHPEVAFEWLATDALRLEADFDFKYRVYGSGSYAEGPGHPPLEEGERRYDLRFTPGIEMTWKFAEAWAITTELEYTMRRTNFPDYAPGVFPASRQYTIQWDYDNFRAVAGIELALEAAPDAAQ